MLTNIFYSLFFGLVNILIYLKLQKSIQPPKVYLYYIFIAVVFLLHLGFVKNNYLMPEEDFFNLSFFSVGLVVLHFMTNIQVAIFKKYNKPQDERGQKLQAVLLTVYDFMRQKLIYIMFNISQVLDIWNESYR